MHVKRVLCTIPLICLGSMQRGKCEFNTLGEDNFSSSDCGAISNIVKTFGIGMVSALPFTSMDITSNPQCVPVKDKYALLYRTHPQ